LKPEHTDVTASVPVDAPMPVDAAVLVDATELFARIKKDGVHSVTESCRPVTEILSRIGDKWSVMIVRLLGPGPKRFNEIKRAINGISQRMLTLTLRGLERDGLVTRTVTPSIPPRVDYELTSLGQSLHAPIDALGAWAFANRPEIEASRTRFDAAADRSGH
jgi:DNA-binding HxlR family transcriptional regulator